jgi:hypothetical protein
VGEAGELPRLEVDVGEVCAWLYQGCIRGRESLRLASIQLGGARDGEDVISIGERAPTHACNTDSRHVRTEDAEAGQDGEAEADGAGHGGAAQVPADDHLGDEGAGDGELLCFGCVVVCRWVCG